MENISSAVKCVCVCERERERGRERERERERESLSDFCKGAFRQAIDTFLLSHVKVLSFVHASPTMLSLYSQAATALLRNRSNSPCCWLHHERKQVCRQNCLQVRTAHAFGTARETNTQCSTITFKYWDKPSSVQTIQSNIGGGDLNFCILGAPPWS